MQSISVQPVRSDRVYEKILTSPEADREDIYREGLLRPFEKKWAMYRIPLRAETPGGFDAAAASARMGHLSSSRIDQTQAENIRLLSEDGLWQDCREAILRSLRCFTDRGAALPVERYLFTVLLADGQNPGVRLNEGYCGDGGIPGYITAWLTPNPETLRRLPAALAHETNHNVRFQFVRWRPDVSLGEMIVSEGLAENFAVELYGEELAGPWVVRTGRETLEGRVKPVIRDHLDLRGPGEANAYLYGDALADIQGLAPVGLPYCAGYACGYHLVRHFLQKTGTGIVDATLLPAEEILREAEDFWPG